MLIALCKSEGDMGESHIALMIQNDFTASLRSV